MGTLPLLPSDDGTPRIAPRSFIGERIGCSPHKKGTATQLYPRGYPTRTAHPRVGDIVIFDTRLPHRGQRAQNSWHQVRPKGMRVVATLTYGAANNTFTDAYDRAFAWRTAFFNDARLANISGNQRLRKQMVWEDIKRNGVPPELNKLRLDSPQTQGVA